MNKKNIPLLILWLKMCVDVFHEKLEYWCQMVLFSKVHKHNSKHDNSNLLFCKSNELYHQILLHVVTFGNVFVTLNFMWLSTIVQPYVTFVWLAQVAQWPFSCLRYQTWNCTSWVWSVWPLTHKSKHQGRKYKTSSCSSHMSFFKFVC